MQDYQGMMMRKIKWISLFVAVGAYANVGCPLPNEDLSTVVGEVRTSLRETCQHAATADEVRQVIRSTFMEHVDSSMITKQVLGRKYWFESPEEDRKKLQELLEVLLIKQYSEAFNCQYVDSRVEIFPVRGEVKRYSRVESSVYLIGEDPIQVKYALRCDDTEWKIFDIVVDGLSIAQTYRAQFNRLLAKGGIKALNDYLEHKLIGGEDDTQDR